MLSVGNQFFKSLPTLIERPFLQKHLYLLQINFLINKAAYENAKSERLFYVCIWLETIPLGTYLKSQRIFNWFLLHPSN